MPTFQNLKQKIIIFILIVGALLILIFQRGLASSPSSNQTSIQNEDPRVVSTNPSPLGGATILATQPIEITFNLPVENIGELKYKIEPAFELKLELSEDRKTGKFTPVKPFELGNAYTLYILPGTKFDGHKILPAEILLHFKTIPYRGV